MCEWLPLEFGSSSTCKISVGSHDIFSPASLRSWFPSPFTDQARFAGYAGYRIHGSENGHMPSLTRSLLTQNISDSSSAYVLGFLAMNQN